jgi:RNA polymerase sigma factor (sigma-70 family)
MDQPTDVTALVDGARRGDQGAWDELVDRFLPLVGAVWLRLVEHLGGLREPCALPGWIATTTRNECLRSIDRSKRSFPVDPQVPSCLDRAEDVDLIVDLIALERQQALRAALTELPDSRRELLVLLLADPPLPYREISRRLGIPIGSIGPTRARALEQLRNSTALRGFLAGATPDLRAAEQRR